MSFSRTDIAIIGMAGRFPGAPDVDAFWENLCNEVESVRQFTTDQLEALGVDSARLRNPGFVRASSFLENIEWFDAPFFNISPREAELMDPQHRLFLECAWEALERAGYAGESETGSVGVFGGATINTYLLCNLMQSQETDSVDLVQLNVGNSHDFLTTRVSYKLNLRGPSMAIQTACSSSLVAVHHACQSILHGECDMALAGGVSANLKFRYGYDYVERGMASPDGHCRAFDSRAQGTIFGSGAGIVVLKAREAAVRDGDHIYAIIQGSAVNNDGSLKVGYTAPGVDGQAAVIMEAMANANAEPHTIGYVETHGTGTALGDPIEIQALARAFRMAGGKNTCGIGSVKTNIGHLDAAAGVTGLIKTALALKHQRIPATLHFESPNPHIDFESTPFYVVTKLTEWKSPHGMRRAGVSAFGVGGTNAHVVLEEAPEVSSEPGGRPWQLLTLSARTETALQKSTDNLIQYLRQTPETPIEDVAFTLQTGRRRFAHRRFVVCSEAEPAWLSLQKLDSDRARTAGVEEQDRPVVFLFPGQGSQFVDMGKGLYRHEPLFRATVDHCSALLEPVLGIELKRTLYPEDDKRSESAELLNQTWLTQPALFVIEYALARLLMSWGVSPGAMIGHSIGEYVAACLADVLRIEDALRLVAIRGRLMQSVPPGAMLAVAMAEGEVEALCDRRISLAAVNGPSQCVLSGEVQALAELEQQLQSDGITCRRLQTSHAFHSHMVEPILAAFSDEVGRIRLQPPRLRYLSNVTGQWIKAEEATSPAYWVRHLRQTVRFSQSIARLFEDSNWLLVETGPGHSLTQMAQRHKRHGSVNAFLTTLSQPEPEHLGLLLGRLWLEGAPIQWSAFYAQERRRRVVLPTYPFERRKYWIEPARRRAEKPSADASAKMEQPMDSDSEQGATAAASGEVPDLPGSRPLHPRPALKTPYVPPTTTLEKSIAVICRKVLGITEIGIDDIFFELGGDSLLALQVVTGIRQELNIHVPVANLYEQLTIRSLASSLPNGNGGGGKPNETAEADDDRRRRAERRKHYQQKQFSRKSEE